MEQKCIFKQERLQGKDHLCHAVVWEDEEVDVRQSRVRETIHKVRHDSVKALDHLIQLSAEWSTFMPNMVYLLKVDG